MGVIIGNFAGIHGTLLSGRTFRITDGNLLQAEETAFVLPSWEEVRQMQRTRKGGREKKNCNKPHNGLVHCL